METRPDTTTVYLGLGSNMGDRRTHLDQAVNDLAAVALTRVVAVSRYHDSEPQDMDYDGLFLNAVVKLETGLDAHALLDALQAIELKHGRGLRPGRKKLPRPLDIDILLFGAQSISTPRLTVPHPGIAARPFVQTPLKELGAQF